MLSRKNRTPLLIWCRENAIFFKSNYKFGGCGESEFFQTGWLMPGRVLENHFPTKAKGALPHCSSQTTRMTRPDCGLKTLPPSWRDGFLLLHHPHWDLPSLIVVRLSWTALWPPATLPKRGVGQAGEQDTRGRAGERASKRAGLDSFISWCGSGHFR